MLSNTSRNTVELARGLCVASVTVLAEAAAHVKCGDFSHLFLTMTNWSPASGAGWDHSGDPWPRDSDLAAVLDKLDQANQSIASLRSSLNLALKRIDVLHNGEACVLAAIQLLQTQSHQLTAGQTELMRKVELLRAADESSADERVSRRRDRPRSGSLPPDLCCSHHKTGNTVESAPSDEHGMIAINTISEAHSWWSHMDSVLFYDKQVLAAEFWSWLEINFHRSRITILHYYSKNVRHFVIKCKCCTEKFSMVYDKALAKDVTDNRCMDLARFTNSSATSAVHGS